MPNALFLSFVTTMSKRVVEVIFCCVRNLFCSSSRQFAFFLFTFFLRFFHFEMSEVSKFG